MRKSISAVTALTMLMLVSVACGKKESNPNRDAARSLYEKVTALTRNYTDSIIAASDTVRVNELLQQFEEKIDKMNFDVPANTDYSLTEGENDTISLLLEKMAKVRRDKFKELSALSHPTDSIPASSVSDMPDDK